MPSMEEVQHMARLARLQLSPAELEQMREQLSAILDYIEVLREVDTSAIPATAQVLPLENVTRPDRVTPSLPPDEVLFNAPDQEEGLFRIPPVLE